MDRLAFAAHIDHVGLAQLRQMLAQGRLAYTDVRLQRADGSLAFREFTQDQEPFRVGDECEALDDMIGSLLQSGDARIFGYRPRFLKDGKP